MAVMPYMSMARNCVAHAALTIFHFKVFFFHLLRQIRRIVTEGGLCVVVAGLYA
jgi:hypothetical protein